MPKQNPSILLKSYKKVVKLAAEISQENWKGIWTFSRECNPFSNRNEFEITNFTWKQTLN